MVIWGTKSRLSARVTLGQQSTVTGFPFFAIPPFRSLDAHLLVILTSCRHLPMSVAPDCNEWKLHLPTNKTCISLSFTLEDAQFHRIGQYEQPLGWFYTP